MAAYIASPDRRTPITTCRPAWISKPNYSPSLTPPNCCAPNCRRKTMSWPRSPWAPIPTRISRSKRIGASPAPYWRSWSKPVTRPTSPPSPTASCATSICLPIWRGTGWSRSCYPSPAWTRPSLARWSPAPRIRCAGSRRSANWPKRASPSPPAFRPSSPPSPTMRSKRWSPASHRQARAKSPISPSGCRTKSPRSSAPGWRPIIPIARAR